MERTRSGSRLHPAAILLRVSCTIHQQEEAITIFLTQCYARQLQYWMAGDARFHQSEIRAELDLNSNELGFMIQCVFHDPSFGFLNHFVMPSCLPSGAPPVFRPEQPVTTGRRDSNIEHMVRIMESRLREGIHCRWKKSSIGVEVLLEHRNDLESGHIKHHLTLKFTRYRRAKVARAQGYDRDRLHWSSDVIFVYQVCRFAA